MQKASFIYFFVENSKPYIKIGKSNDPYFRMKSLSQQIDLDLSFCIKTTNDIVLKIEKFFHFLFRDYKGNHPIGGTGFTEWFDISAYDVIIKFISENHTLLGTSDIMYEKNKFDNNNLISDTWFKYNPKYNREIGEEALRVHCNISMCYQNIIDPMRELQKMPYGMKYKTVKNGEYLYEIFDRNGNAKCLGRKSEELNKVFEKYSNRKGELKNIISSTKEKIMEYVQIYKVLRPYRLLDNKFAETLRDLDISQNLGKNFVVVSNEVFLAYELESCRNINFLRTEYNLVIEKSSDTEWLFNGRLVEHILIAKDGSLAKIIAPDPRWFVAYHLYYSDKDYSEYHKEIGTLLKIIKDHMPHYRIDAEFINLLPKKIQHYFK